MNDHEPADVSNNNPYQPPRSLGLVAGEVVCVARSVKFDGAYAEFLLRSHGGRRLGIYWAGFSGLEVYSVDGEERLRVRNSILNVRGHRRFRLADNDPHEVEVKYRYFPWWEATVIVDGQTVLAELFPRLRFFFRAATLFIAVELAALAALLGVVFLVTA